MRKMAALKSTKELKETIRHEIRQQWALVQEKARKQRIEILRWFKAA